MSTFYSDLFSKSDWCQIWDNIIFNAPEFFYFVLLAFLKLSRGALMSITDKSDFEVYN